MKEHLEEDDIVFYSDYSAVDDGAGCSQGDTIIVRFGFEDFDYSAPEEVAKIKVGSVFCGRKGMFLGDVS